MASSHQLTAALTAHAQEHGIDLIGYTSARATVRLLRFNNTAGDVFDILPGARSIVIAALHMYGCDVVLPSEPGVPRGKTGPWTRPYTDASDHIDRVVTTWLHHQGYRAVYTNQLAMRALAVSAGLGQYGKNGFVWTKPYGSYLRWGCVVTDAELECVDGPMDVDVSACKNCTICIDACPTGAFRGPMDYDWDLCLHQWLQGKGLYGEILPREERHKCGTYLMRTGLCLEVCPRNRNLVPRGPLPFEVEDKPDCPELIPLVLADEDELMARLPRNCIKYGLENVRRNAIIALGNVGDPAAIPVLARSLADDARWPARIRGVAAWALGRIGTAEAQAALVRSLATEGNDSVRDEIEAALGDILASRPIGVSTRDDEKEGETR